MCPDYPDDPDWTESDEEKTFRYLKRMPFEYVRTLLLSDAALAVKVTGQHNIPADIVAKYLAQFGWTIDEFTNEVNNIQRKNNELIEKTTKCI